MNDERSKSELEQKVLPEPVATRVLARAIELEQTRATGSTVADLRAVAGEVGVSSGSFDAALAELDANDTSPVPVQARVPKRVRLSVVAGVVIAIFAFFVFLRIPGQAAHTVPMIESSVVLRCLTADEAGQLVRPILNLPQNSLVARAAEGSRVLNIKATPAQWQQVRSLLDEQERAGSAACTTRPTPPGTS